MFKYSIIIPVYNSEKFLADCLNSILCQTYTDFEIILVDDCSSDSSPAICDEFAEKYPDKVKAIHCETNGGVAQARNIGLENATGDYIGFTDNDDRWQFDYSLCEIDKKLSASKADMLVYGTSLYMDKAQKTELYGNTFKESMIENQDCFQAVRTMVKHDFINFAVWSKLVKREIIIENNILFPKNKRNEDTDWLAKVFAKINSVDSYEKALYLYRIGNDYSQTSKPLKRQYVDDLKEILIENIKAAALLDAERRDMIYDFLCQAYTVYLSQLALFDDIEADIKEIKQYSFILKCGSKPYVKYLYLFYRIFGIKLTMRVLNIMLLKQHPHLKASKDS